MSLLPEHIEEPYRTTSELRRSYAELNTPLLNETAHRTCLAYTRKVTLHISHEARYTCLAESLRKNLKRYSLAGTGRSCYQSMTVCHLSADGNRAVRAMGYIQAVLFCKHILFFNEFLCLFEGRYNMREDMIRAKLKINSELDK